MDTSASGKLFKELLKMVFNKFEVKDLEKFRTFSSAVEYYTQYIFQQDKIIDNDINWSVDRENVKNSTLYLSHQFHQSAIKLLSNVFPDNHDFWPFLQQKELQYFQRICTEKHLSIQKEDMSITAFEDLAVGKHILSIVPIYAMFHLGSSSLEYAKVEQIFSKIFCAIQMLDDFDDFDRDLKDGQWTYLQSEVLRTINVEELVREESIPDLEKRVLYAADLAQYALEYSQRKFESAKLLAVEQDLTEIVLWLDAMIDETKRQQEFILSLT